MKKLGLIVNPIAGIGGKVGLKGSDGLEVLAKALKLGAKPEAPLRALECLKVIADIKEQIAVITCPKEMGEEAALQAGFPLITTIGTIESGKTTSLDTVKAAQGMAELGVDLLLFAGGDGTARNIYEAIGNRIPVLGIPAGVKIHSAVYGINPKAAGRAATVFLQGRHTSIREAEVMDIDEEFFRQGRLKAKLYGYLLVPEQKTFMQNVKAGSYSENEALEGIALEIVSKMEQDVYYVLGPGTTTRSIMHKLKLPKTLLGVDVVLNKRLVAQDVDENQLLQIISGKRAKIIITAIGGQGHIFGRGNQQISPRVIKTAGKENIIVVASKEKLIKLLPAPLIVDTGDAELDRELCGYVRVVTGFEDYVPYQVNT